MSKQDRQPGIHLHKTKVTIRNARYTKTGTPAVAPIVKAEWYWILIARNGKTIARSSETYKMKRTAVKSISIAAKLFANAVGMFGGYYIDHTGKEVKTDYYDHL